MIDCTIKIGKAKSVKNESDTSASKMNISDLSTLVKLYWFWGNSIRQILFFFPTAYVVFVFG